MQDETIHFPDFEVDSTFDVPPAAICAIVGAVVLASARYFGIFAKIIGLLCFAPYALLLVNSLRVYIVNSLILFCWARAFERRTSSWRLKSLVQSEPERYVLHVRYFGGFDKQQPRTPTAILENRALAQLTAVYPSSWRAIKVCGQAGVEVRSKPLSE